MKKLFLTSAIIGLLSLGAPVSVLAQTTEIVVPANLTVANVTAQCGSVATSAECLAYVKAFVAQTKANGGAIAAQRSLLNSLVVGLAGLSANNPALNSLIADAVTSVASDAPDLVNAAALNQIAESIAAGDTETVTASLGALASPN